LEDGVSGTVILRALQEKYSYKDSYSTVKRFVKDLKDNASSDVTVILDSLEIRTHQAIEKNLAYTDYLALLLQDETARKNSKKLMQRLCKAGVRSNKTIELFDFSSNLGVDKKQIWILPRVKGTKNAKNNPFESSLNGTFKWRL